MLEEALQQKEGVLNALLNNIPDMAWLKDKKSRFIAVNESYGKACGCDPESVVGKTDLDIWPRELALYYRKYDRDVMRTRQRIAIEEPLVDRQGRTLWIEAIKTPIIDAKGRVTGLAGIARDITERRILIEKLRAGEEAMRQAMKERETLARDLHDQSIQALYALGLELELCSQLMPESARKTGRRLRAIIKELNTTIRELRSFITDVRTIKPPPFFLDREIQVFLDRIRKTRAVRVLARIDEEACKLLDAGQSAHVLNIVREAVSNSLRHSKARHVTVSIARKKGQVCIVIRDDGVGIVKQDFDRKGFGLNNICARVAEMKGRMQIRSKEGRGTSVRIVLGEGG
ncbi:MAG: hypothetical protein A2X46_09325 [Lentisphaerae bacterium GWF2_57_35]|nr:MAG: hypothetical protein A2X46_09325 [Lentisphaerae bacterium GWF2_57_35]